MFSKIAKFFIENWKLTFVLVLITIITWFWSYIILPKQYNPSIIVPAFQIIVESPWLDIEETSNLIVSPMENKIMELEGIDEVYWVAWDNYGAVMVKFEVWIDKEKAKVRLTQKLTENLDLKPIWVKNPIIKTIDPDELAQITFAISYNDSKLENNNLSLTKEDKYIYLRQVANILKNKIKTIENVTTIDIVWAYTKNIIVELDLSKIEAKNTDIMQVYDILEKNNLNLPVWNINTKSWNKVFIEVKWKTQKLEQIRNIIISQIWEFPLYLKDIANIRYWVKRLDKESTFSKVWEKTKTSVFLWVWKRNWTNAVFVTDNIIKEINEFKKSLAKNIDIEIIQNEWETAKKATNMLLVNLSESIIIVFIILALYLGVKNALNTSLSIPLTLWIVFLLAYIFWENINKITLFALILVLWMLVDNSTVVVENISRHLRERWKYWKTKKEAVLNWVSEVWIWVILSTISRLLAFWAMFAVTWMMWEYMWPIPKFAIWALLASLFIAFTINPWFSYIFAKDFKKWEEKIEKDKESPLKIRRKYLKIMRFFINKENRWNKRIKIFKFFFWLSLLFFILAPIYLWIFKARMLPKSNQNQVYLWIDAPREWNINKVSEIEKDLITFFDNSYFWNKLNNNLQIVDSVSITTWQAFIWDFANLFRGWNSRINENQLSARINLINSNIYKDKFWKKRIKSEEYVIKIRPILRDYLYKKYPDLQFRLLEDPPGPPVRATFLAKIKTDATKENEDIFSLKIEKEIRKISQKEKIVDIWNSKQSTYKKINIDIDKESLSRAGLSTKQVAYSLAIVLNWVDINLIKNENSFEPNNIVLTVAEHKKNSIWILKEISFTNQNWEKVPLSSIATFNYTFIPSEINTDKRKDTIYIYGEMWDNSLIYPVIKLYSILTNDNFLKNNYKVLSVSPYKIEYLWLQDWKKYTLEWWGEWELTMDTFRDLWIAMIISLLAIYFLLVWQFASFWIAWIIMITFLLSFFGIFPGFTFLYLLQNEYFSATSMIWIIALWWIVVWNAIILIDYLNILKKNKLTIEEALLKSWYVRFAPIILTSLTTVFWAATIIWDPVWSWLAWAIIWWLLLSSILTLIVIPIFYYDSQKEIWEK